MSFTGDLEHLPIVDVIQLLHATKKSGTLTVKGGKGESQLVFEDGYVVSANHLNDSVRIGKVLVGMGAITEETLRRALADQKAAGTERKPLIAMLIERGEVGKEEAFKGLETLIELTVVEILTWETGTFSLDVEKINISDEYRYLPEKLHQDMHLNTQNVLMDALRIYDEKKRDGELDEEAFPAEEPLDEGGAGEGGEFTLSADDLGLADLERLERKITGVFSSLQEVDPSESRRREIRAAAPGFSVSEQEEFLAYLLKRSGGTGRTGAEARTVVLFSSDEFLKYAVTTVCKQEGTLVFATDEEANLGPIIDRSLAKNDLPVLVLDHLPGEGGRTGALLRLKKGKYPHLPILQLASPLDYALSLQALTDGARAVFPRPVREERGESFVTDAAGFLEALLGYLREIGGEPPGGREGGLRRRLAALQGLREPQEVARVLLQQVAEIFERSVTLVVGQGELIAERGIGIGTEKGKHVSPALGFRIPLGGSPVLQQVLGAGKAFLGRSDDRVVREHLFSLIGAPSLPTILLLPLQSRGRTVSLTYGDFGGKEESPVPLELLEIVSRQAGLILENAWYRKRLEGAPRQG